MWIRQSLKFQKSFTPSVLAYTISQNEKISHYAIMWGYFMSLNTKFVLMWYFIIKVEIPHFYYYYNIELKEGTFFWFYGQIGGNVNYALRLGNNCFVLILPGGRLYAERHLFLEWYQSKVGAGRMGEVWGILHLNRVKMENKLWNILWK